MSNIVKAKNKVTDFLNSPRVAELLTPHPELRISLGFALLDFFYATNEEESPPVVQECQYQKDDIRWWLGRRVKFPTVNGTCGIVSSVHKAAGLVYVEAPGFATIPSPVHKLEEVQPSYPVSDARPRADAGKPWAVFISDREDPVTVTNFHYCLGR